MLGKSKQQRDEEECTRDVVFLLMVNRSKPERTPPSRFQVDSVWLDRDEVLRYAEGRSYHYGVYGPDWFVFGAPANGSLAALLAFQDLLTEGMTWEVEHHAGKDSSLPHR